MTNKEIPRAFQGRRIRLLFRLVINGFLQVGATVANAKLVKLCFDRLITSVNPAFNTMALPIGVGLFAATGILAWLRVVERIDAERLSQEYACEIRMALYNKLASVAPRALQSRTHGGLMLRFVGDLNSVRKWVSLGLARLIIGGVTIVGTLLALALISKTLAITIALVLLLGILTAYKVGQQMQKAAKEARRRLSRLAGNINEKVATIAVVQVFGQSEREEKRLARQSKRLEDAMVNRAVVAGQLRGLTEITATFASGAALLVGAAEVAAGHTTPGTVVAAMTVVSFLVPRFRDLGRVQEYWHNSRVSLGKIAEFMNIPSLVAEIPKAPDLILGPGSLQFDSVSLGGAISQVSAIARAGEVVALVGPNGAGKSTMLSLAARLIDPDCGTIRLDGQNLATHSLASVRRAIGMATPDLPLLRGTVEQNLLYRWPDAPEEEIRRVWELCGIDEVLAELSEGAQTKVSEGGIGLSAGQRQRITLARAILGNPPILLLDEIDANLDPQATAAIDRILVEFPGTILLITHRFERLNAVDTIWYLEDGKLKEVGSTEVILQGSGPTFKFFNSKLAYL